MTSFARGFSLAAAWILAVVAAAPAAVDVAMAREIVLMTQPGAGGDDVEIRRWQTRATLADAKSTDFERLGWAFVAKARRTLDTGYYKLAEKTADVMDARFGSSVEARLLRGHIFHNLHRFAEAEAVARAVVVERGSATDYALLSDALMEQGNLSGAVDACQQLVNLRPGVEAYSRIAHLRWLKGDLTGAVAMMEAAERAVTARDVENRAWLLVRLSGYASQGGHNARALLLTDNALSAVPDYPPALLARGRALIAMGKNADAIPVLRSAAALNPLPEYQWWLADALRSTGAADAAADVEKAILRHGEAGDGRTLSLWLATNGRDAAQAVRLAQEELVNRKDTFSRDALAWALLAQGDTAGAKMQSNLACAEGTRDARLLWHAGEIAFAAGDREAAEKRFAQAKPFAATLTPSEHARLTGRLGQIVTAQR